MAELTIQGLTVGENLLITRRRENESQEEVAKRLGITRNQYGRLERDQEDCVKVPLLKIDNLSPHEKCFLLRRRAELTQEEVAEEIGVTRFWLNQMELGKVSNAELVKFWESRV